MPRCHGGVRKRGCPDVMEEGEREVAQMLWRREKERLPTCRGGGRKRGCPDVMEEGEREVAQISWRREKERLPRCHGPIEGVGVGFCLEEE